MAQYIVKSGDTLSGIGQKLGVNWQNITGFRSGNPNLIYPGEVLNIPGGAPPQAPTPPIQASPITGEQPITQESNYGQVVLDAINKYMASVSGQKPLSDVRTQYRESLGIPGMETAQTGLIKQVTDVEGLLDKLEADINARGAAVGGVMTEAQLRRRQAAEEKPLREQLSDLYRSETRATAGLGGARQELAAMMQLEEQQRTGQKEQMLGMLPYYEQALTYESPSEKSAREQAEYLSKERAAKAAGLGSYYQKPGTAPGVETTKGGMQQYLANQGIPLTVATSKGELTTSALNKIVSNGVPLDKANWIWANMQAGNDFETIREGMRGEGIDTGDLDKFVMALQGIKKEETSTETTDLENILKELNTSWWQKLFQ